MKFQDLLKAQSQDVTIDYYGGYLSKPLPKYYCLTDEESTEAELIDSKYGTSKTIAEEVFADYPEVLSNLLTYLDSLDVVPANVMNEIAREYPSETIELINKKDERDTKIKVDTAIMMLNRLPDSYEEENIREVLENENNTNLLDRLYDFYQSELNKVPFPALKTTS